MIPNNTITLLAKNNVPVSSVVLLHRYTIPLKYLFSKRYQLSVIVKSCTTIRNMVAIVVTTNTFPLTAISL